MKDTEHIRRDFYSVTWVMPQGGPLGCWGARRGGGVKIDYGLNMVLSNRRGLQAEQNASKVKLVTLGEVKSSNIITFVDFGYHVNCKDFYTNFCVCSHQ